MEAILGSPLSPADAACLRTEEAVNPLVSNGLLLFDEPLDLGRLRTVLANRLLPVPRFRMKVVEPASLLAPPRWEPDPDFDLDRHVSVHPLADPSREHLQAMAGELVSRPLDPGRPLWRWHVLPRAGRGTAVLARFHHAMADGMALMRLLLRLADGHPEGWRNGSPSAGPLTDGGPPLEVVRRVVSGSGRGLLAHAGSPLQAARRLLDSVRSVLRVVLLEPDADTPYRGPLGTAKKVAVSDPIPLEPVKEVARATGATVNDLLLAALAGALRRHLLSRGHEPRGGLRVAMPVDMRPPEDDSLGNRFGVLFLTLPVDEPDPGQRLRVVRRRTALLKRSAESLASFTALQVSGFLPRWLEQGILRYFDRRISGLATNVRGPSQRLYLAGVPLRSLAFWVPQTGHVSLGLSILSYAGEIRVGVSADAGRVPDPERLVEEFHRSLAELGAGIR